MKDNTKAAAKNSVLVDFCGTSILLSFAFGIIYGLILRPSSGFSGLDSVLIVTVGTIAGVMCYAVLFVLLALPMVTLVKWTVTRMNG